MSSSEERVRVFCHANRKLATAEFPRVLSNYRREGGGLEYFWLDWAVYDQNSVDVARQPPIQTDEQPESLQSVGLPVAIQPRAQLIHREKFGKTFSLIELVNLLLTRGRGKEHGQGGIEGAFGPPQSAAGEEIRESRAQEFLVSGSAQVMT